MGVMMMRKQIGILGVGLDIKYCVAILSNHCSQIRIKSEMNEKSWSRKSKS